jgi:hypothetical protein
VVRDATEQEPQQKLGTRTNDGPATVVSDEEVKASKDLGGSELAPTEDISSTSGKDSSSSLFENDFPWPSTHTGVPPKYRLQESASNMEAFFIGEDAHVVCLTDDNSPSVKSAQAMGKGVARVQSMQGQSDTYTCASPSHTVLSTVSNHGSGQSRENVRQNSSEQSKTNNEQLDVTIAEQQAPTKVAIGEGTKPDSKAFPVEICSSHRRSLGERSGEVRKELSEPNAETADSCARVGSLHVEAGGNNAGTAQSPSKDTPGSKGMTSCALRETC